MHVKFKQAVAVCTFILFTTLNFMNMKQFTHSLAEEHLNVFQLLAIINTDTMNICV